jgi:hypothetical protein
LPSQPINQVSFDKHASDVFQALVELSNTRTPDNSKLFMRFVWLRCHPKIKHRLRADEAMLKKPLADLLDEWMNKKISDTVEEEWLATSPALYSFYDKSRIVSRFFAHKGTREYLFSSNTIHPWCKIFVRCLRKLKKEAASCDMSSPKSIDRLTDLFQILSRVLYQNRALDKILALPSLSGHLEAARRTRANKTNKTLGVF